jgi:hypothetical protein
LAELQKAGGKAWEEFKSGMDAAIDDLREAYNKLYPASSKLKISRADPSSRKGTTTGG